MTEAKKTRARGGPQTVAGKAMASKNAATHGIWATWLTESEHGQYESACDEFLEEYGAGPTVRLLVEELVVARIKLNRVRRTEQALYERARLLRRSIESKPHANSIASTIPGEGDHLERAMELAAYSAMPDGDVLDRLARYETSFKKDILRCLQCLKVLKDERVLDAPRVLQAKTQAAALPASLPDVESSVIQ